MRMVKVWACRALRWGLLGLTVLIVVVFFGRLILQLEGRVRVETHGRQVAEGALAVDEAKLSVRDNLHVTVTAPAPQVTVTMAGGKTPVVVATGATRVVTVPSPFAVPGPTSTAPAATPVPQPTPTQCPLLCSALRLIGL
jgi:ABC-type Fe3+-hydroxamate transport system substrate-binding protein